MIAIKIDPEFRDLIPPLSPDEFDQLERSVAGQGVLSPLLVWKEEDILVDGHNRYKICTEFKKPFTTKELSFSDREEVKRFIILNQLGRRNVTPETASKLRAEYAESMSKGQGGDRKSEKSKLGNQALISTPQKTATAVAKATGVSTSTIESDKKLMKSLDKLGISRNDYAAGKVLDDKGKKRSKKSIIEEAFPPTRRGPNKPKARPAVLAPEPQAQPEDEALLMDSIVIEDEEPQPLKKEIPLDQDPWLITLQQLPKLTKEQRQELLSILQSKWDCKPVQS
jgi:hypothetical protein